MIASCSRRRVLPLDQVLQRRGEVVEHVLLLREVALQVPVLAELAAAADVGHGDDEPVVEQHAVERAERRRMLTP